MYITLPSGTSHVPPLSEHLANVSLHPLSAGFQIVLHYNALLVQDETAAKRSRNNWIPHPRNLSANYNPVECSFLIGLLSFCNRYL